MSARALGYELTILLVDDDPLQAFVRKSILEKRFSDVLRVTGAAEALCLVEQPHFARKPWPGRLGTPSGRYRRTGICGRVTHAYAPSPCSRPRRFHARKPAITPVTRFTSCPGQSCLKKSCQLPLGWWRKTYASRPDPHRIAPKSRLPLTDQWCEPNHTQKAYDGLRITSLGFSPPPHCVRESFWSHKHNGSIR